MSDWDKIAADAAIEYAKPTMRPLQTMSDHMADAFHEGARWQREAMQASIGDAVRKLQAIAWDEGHARGRDYQGDGWNADAHDPRNDNPYREGRRR